MSGGRVPWLRGPAAIAEWLKEWPRTEENGWPLCEHTHTVPGCVPCAYRAWANGRNSTFTSHGIPYEAFRAGYIARGNHGH
jgi:hypothetical protein